MDESQPCKRKRVVTACDTCRKSKIKCDGELPQCSRCARIKSSCIYTPVARKNVPIKRSIEPLNGDPTAPADPQTRTKLIEGLEDRLNRIESFVMSDLVSESMDTKAGNRPQGRSSTCEANGGGHASMRSYTSRPAAATPLSARNGPPPRIGPSRPGNDTATPRSEGSILSVTTADEMSMDFVNTDVKGQSQYIGSASGFSIFSPKGIAWINEKVGDSQFVSVLSSAKCDDAAWGKSNIINDITSKKLHRRLPPKEEARAIIRQYFANFKFLTPLFHEAAFMSLFETRFTQEFDPVHGPGWWASLNMVLSMTHQVRVLYDLTLQDDEELSVLYFKNAMAVLTEILLLGPNILSVQALLAMAIYSQGTSNVELSCFLGAAAVRVSQNMGMHRESSSAGLSLQDASERRTVFWIGYILDKNTSLRYGRPPNQDDDDMDVELPGIELYDGMCKLAIIEGKVYNRLYSARASKQSIEEIVNTVDQLDEELGNWRLTIPEEFRPESEIKASDELPRLQIVNFHMAYYHCLAAIHRKLVQHSHWVSGLDAPTEDEDTEQIHKRVFSSAVLCVSAARASINLIRFIPQGNLACIWIMLCYVVMSYLALCVNIYQNPEDPKATLDLKLMRIVTNFLFLLRTDETDPGSYHLIQICGEFERLARRAVKNAQEKRSSQRALDRASLDSAASNDQTTPPSTSGPTHIESFPLENKVVTVGGGLQSDSIPQGAAGYSSFRDPAPTMQRPGALLYNSEIAEAPQSMGNGGDEMEFPNNAILPAYTGGTTSSDFWQLPMPLEWNWTDMNANYFLPME